MFVHGPSPRTYVLTYVRSHLGSSLSCIRTYVRTYVRESWFCICTEHTMDMDDFMAACDLADAQADETKSSAGASGWHPQGTLGRKNATIWSDPQVIEIDEEDVPETQSLEEIPEQALSQGDASNAGAEIGIARERGTKRKLGSFAARSAAQGNTKSKRKGSSLGVKTCTASQGGLVETLSIEKKGEKGGKVVLPMWSQYSLTFKGKEIPWLQGMKWISVATYEQWMLALVNAMRPPNSKMGQKSLKTREIAKAISDCFRQELRECLQALEESDSQEADGDGENGDAYFALNNLKEKSQCRYKLVDVKIGEFKVQALNTTERCLLKVDENTAEFIASWVVSMVKEVSKNGGACKLDSESDKTLATFQFKKMSLPNIRDKIKWIPYEQRWNIYVQKPKEQVPPKEEFAVEGKTQGEYDVKKTSQYWLAVAAWNRIDGSTRHRIPMTCQISMASDSQE